MAIDLNAVPPSGIGGLGVTDKAKPIGSGVGYGAIGVGGLKMKTHRAAIESLFTSNDRVLDAERDLRHRQIYRVTQRRLRWPTLGGGGRVAKVGRRRSGAVVAVRRLAADGNRIAIPRVVDLWLVISRYATANIKFVSGWVISKPT